MRKRWQRKGSEMKVKRKLEEGKQRKEERRKWKQCRHGERRGRDGGGGTLKRRDEGQEEKKRGGIKEKRNDYRLSLYVQGEREGWRERCW